MNNTKMLSVLAVFAFVLVTKGWQDYPTDVVIRHVLEQAPDLKAVMFWDRPWKNAWYDIGDSITFYNKNNDLNSQLHLADHELCHRRQYLRSHVINHVECPT